MHRCASGHSATAHQRPCRLQQLTQIGVHNKQQACSHGALERPLLCQSLRDDVVHALGLHALRIAGASVHYAPTGGLLPLCDPCQPSAMLSALWSGATQSRTAGVQPSHSTRGIAEDERLEQIL